jgi:hypothetical protein
MRFDRYRCRNHLHLVAGEQRHPVHPVPPPAARVPGADALKPVPDCDRFGQSTPDVEFDLRAW